MPDMQKSNTRREWITLLIVAAFVGGTATNLDTANVVFIQAKDFVVVTFDWFFTGVTTLCLITVLWIGVDPRFNVRLGRDDERPEFTNLAWFAMLFSAGLASGVLYWATAEPITHFQGNPHLEMAGAQALTTDAARKALTVTIFHWGLHGWGLYVLTGLSIAFFAYRQGQPLAMRSTLYPLIGERVNGWPGAVVDIIAVVGTVFGVATSIGLGFGGMNAALSELTGIAINTTNQLLIVALVCGLGIFSVISGVSRGIRLLSEINIWLSAALLVAVLAVGPTAFLLGFVFTSLWDYPVNVLPMGFWTADDPVGQAWQGAWTVFYWGWWLAWTPFVGLFIARISRGRTVREFVLGGDAGAYPGSHCLDVGFWRVGTARRTYRAAEHHRPGQR
jgi:choline/glycine/proline betaine transport protein